MFINIIVHTDKLFQLVSSISLSFKCFRGISLNVAMTIKIPHCITQKDTEDYYEAFTLLSAMFEESPLKVYSRMHTFSH